MIDAASSPNQINMKTIINVLVMGAILATGSLRSSGATVQLSETFDTASSAASDGWWEYGSRNSNPAKAPYFGWSNTNLATGSAGVGGGLIGRINNYDFYGNVFANLGVMSMTNTLTMSGNFFIQQEATNNDLRFGYFQYDTINKRVILNQDADVLGFYFNEPHSPGPNNAMRIGITTPPNNEVQAPFWVYSGTNYSWTWTIPSGALLRAPTMAPSRLLCLAARPPTPVAPSAQAISSSITFPPTLHLQRAAPVISPLPLPDILSTVLHREPRGSRRKGV